MIRRIGLTGGIGAGKSTVANILREKGVTVIDLDQIGREITDTNTDIQKQVLVECGLKAPFHRDKVREAVFANPTTRQNVEKILHPIIIKESETKIREAEKSGKKAIVIEAALILETGYADQLNDIILVTAKPAVRRERLQKQRRLAEAVITQILMSQIDPQDAAKRATYKLDNNGTLEQLQSKVDALVREFKLNAWNAAHP